MAQNALLAILCALTGAIAGVVLFRVPEPPQIEIRESGVGAMAAAWAKDRTDAQQIQEEMRAQIQDLTQKLKEAKEVIERWAW